MWQVTTQGTLCRFLKILRYLQFWKDYETSFSMITFINWSPTFEDMRTSWCIFLIMFLIFYKLFCLISQNKSGRHKVPFVLMRHKCKSVRPICGCLCACFCILILKACIHWSVVKHFLFSRVINFHANISIMPGTMKVMFTLISMHVAWRFQI